MEVIILISHFILAIVFMVLSQIDKDGYKITRFFWGVAGLMQAFLLGAKLAEYLMKQ